MNKVEEYGLKKLIERSRKLQEFLTENRPPKLVIALSVNAILRVATLYCPSEIAMVFRDDFTRQIRNDTGFCGNDDCDGTIADGQRICAVCKEKVNHLPDPED